MAQLGDKPLANDASAHDDGRVLSTYPLVGGVGHVGGILETSGAGDGVCVARVDDDASQAGIALLLEQLAAEGDGRGLELVLGEDSRGGAGAVGRHEGQIRLAGVARLDADEDTRGDEALGILAAGGHVLDLLGGDGDAAEGRGRRVGSRELPCCNHSVVLAMQMQLSR